MIKVVKGNSHIEGREPEIMSEFAVLIKHLVEKFGKENVDYAYKIANMSDEELGDEVRKKVNSPLGMLALSTVLGDILKDMKERCE